MLRLDQAQRETVGQMLQGIGMEDYVLQVEKAMLGELPPAEVLKLLKLFAETNYLRGCVAGIESYNRLLAIVKEATG